MKNTIGTVPNFLSLFRILIIPVFVYFFLIDWSYGKTLAFALFLLASITDFFDGWIARKYNLVTEIGIFLDQFADKLLVLTSLTLFIFIPKLKVFWWMVAIIVFRDVFIIYMRIVIKKSSGKPMKTSYWGKAKTAMQMFSIVVILLYLSLINFLNPSALQFFIKGQIAFWLILLCVVFTILSLWRYIIDNKMVLSDYFRSKK